MDVDKDGVLHRVEFKGTFTPPRFKPVRFLHDLACPLVKSLSLPTSAVALVGRC